MTAKTQQVHRHLRSGNYYFRVAIPVRLQKRLGSREYKKSLHTADFRVANRICRILSNKAEELFEFMSRMEPTEKDLKQLMRSYFEQQLVEAQSNHQEIRAMFYGSEPDVPELDPYEFTAVAERQYLKLKREAATRDYSPEMEESAENLLEKQKYTASPIHVGSLASYLMDAALEAKRIEIAYHNKDFGGLAIRHPKLAGCYNALEGGGNTVTTLAQCISQYLEQKQDKVEPKTLHSIRAILGRLTDLLGEDKPMQAIEKQPDGVMLERFVPKIPAHFVRDYEGRQLRDVINAGGNYETISRKTAATYWMYMKEFFDWAADRDFLARSPLGKMTIKAPKKDNKARNDFTKEQLLKLFHSPIYTGRKNRQHSLWKPGSIKIKDGNFWLPLIALYTGMREAEILQITAADIKTEGEISYFDVNEQDGKGVKTENGIRCVPIHPELVKIGLLQYVAERKKALKKGGRVFEDGITLPENQEITKNYSRSFSDYTVKIGMRDVKDGKEVFHSFRHNFHTALANAQVLNALTSWITGHKPPSTTQTMGDMVYVHSRPSLKEMYAAVCKVSYGIDLSHLYEEVVTA